jgi:RNA polymerase sigma factor (sigma-70 family)
MDEKQMSLLEAALLDLQAGGEDAAHEVVVLALSSFRDGASNLLRNHFSRLKGHDTDSVVNTAWPQLFRQIRANPPKSVDALLRLACTIIRRDLIDLARRENAPFRNAIALDGTLEQASATPAAEEMASWAELNEAIGRLPDAELRVFELLYYLDMTQVEVADMLGMHPKKVSRLYGEAVRKLAAWMEAAGYLD